MITTAAARHITKSLEAYDRGGVSHDAVIEGSATSYAAAVANKPETELCEAAECFATADTRAVFKFTEHIVGLLQSRHIRPVIISGAPEHPMRLQARLLGVSEFHALQLEVSTGVATGRVLLNPGIADVKHGVVAGLLQGQAAIAELAVGNAESDVPMFHAARVAIVVDNDRLAHRIGGARSVRSDASTDEVLAIVTGALEAPTWS